MKKITLFAFIILLSVNNKSIAQADDVKNSYLIILSTKSYVEAKKAARQAATTLDIEFNLRGLVPNKATGLSIIKEDVLEGTIYPFYTIRDIESNGNYASVEWSTGYKGLAKGFYIVVVSSGKYNEVANYNKKTVKQFYKNAYVKSALIYPGGPG